MVAGAFAGHLGTPATAGLYGLTITITITITITSTIAITMTITSTTYYCSLPVSDTVGFQRFTFMFSSRPWGFELLHAYISSKEMMDSLRFNT